MSESQGGQATLEDCRGASRVLSTPRAGEADHQKSPAAQLQLKLPLHRLEHIHAVADTFDWTQSTRVHQVVVQAANAEHGPRFGYGEPEWNARFRTIGRIQSL